MTEILYGTKGDYRGEGEGKQDLKNGEICSAHYIYLYENLKNNLESSYYSPASIFLFPLVSHSVLPRNETPVTLRMGVRGLRWGGGERV